MLNAILITLLSHLTPLPQMAAALDGDALPCSALGDGLFAEAAEAMAMCSNQYCCTRCNAGKTDCYGCVSGSSCEGDVFTCVGCYSGDNHCVIGSSGSNSCCD